MSSESHRHSAKKTSVHCAVSKGDVVIVHDDTLPRGLWKLGRIQEVLTGSDKQSRAALVRVACRDRQHVLLRRPIELLYPLEIHELETDAEAALSVLKAWVSIYLSVFNTKYNATYLSTRTCYGHQLYISTKPYFYSFQKINYIN